MTAENKTALVTGASGTLGAQIALALGRSGYRVAVHYHKNQAAAAEVVESIQAADGEAIAVAADLSGRNSVAPLFAEVETRLGPVDCLVNSAGINRDAMLALMSDAQWDEVIDTNLRAAAASAISSPPAECAARPANATTPPPRAA
jgi:3-oxoacyl-[acyl-carrier protein] reductase